MNCEDIKPLLYLCVDGELQLKEKHEVDVHLEHCSYCRNKLQTLEDLTASLSRLPQMIPPYSIVDRLLPQLQEVVIESSDASQDVGNSKPIRVKESRNPFFRWTSKNIGLSAVAASVAVVLFIAVQSNLPSTLHNDQFQQSLSLNANQTQPEADQSPAMMTEQSDEAIASDSLVQEQSTQGNARNAPSGGIAEFNQSDANDSGATDVSPLEVIPEAAQESTPSALIESPKNPDQSVGPALKKSLPDVQSERASANGKYLAKFQDQRMIIFEQDSNEMVYQSVHTWEPEDTISELVWSSDSELTYKVSTNGEQKKYIIHVIQQTEREMYQ